MILHDLFVNGTGTMVKNFDDRMEITNPEKPLAGTQRFLDTPPKSRNESRSPWCTDFGFTKNSGVVSIRRSPKLRPINCLASGEYPFQDELRFTPAQGWLEQEKWYPDQSEAWAYHKGPYLCGANHPPAPCAAGFCR